jgi:exosortase
MTPKVDAAQASPHVGGLETRLASNRILLIALLPAIVAAAWLISKAQFYWAKRPEMAFGYMAPMLCGFLFWEIWPTRPKEKFTSVFGPILLALPGLALLFIAQIYMAALGMNPASLVGLTLGTMCVIFANYWWVFGFGGIWHFAFPTMFFLVALPLPTVVYNPVVSALQSLVVSIDVNVLSLFGIPAQRIGNLIHLPSGVVGVNEACSGIRSVQSTIMATLFIGYLVLKNRSLNVALLVVGVGLAVVGNVIRSVYLCFRADSAGLQAVEEAHDAAGWSILVFTTIGVALAAWQFSKFDKAMTALRARAAALKSARNA